jgi:hypothetical protein
MDTHKMLLLWSPAVNFQNKILMALYMVLCMTPSAFGQVEDEPSIIYQCDHKNFCRVKMVC